MALSSQMLQWTLNEQNLQLLILKGIVIRLLDCLINQNNPVNTQFYRDQLSIVKGMFTHAGHGQSRSPLQMMALQMPSDLNLNEQQSAPSQGKGSIALSLGGPGGFNIKPQNWPGAAQQTHSSPSLLCPPQLPSLNFGCLDQTKQQP